MINFMKEDEEFPVKLHDYSQCIYYRVRHSCGQQSLWAPEEKLLLCIECWVPLISVNVRIMATDVNPLLETDGLSPREPFPEFLRSISYFSEDDDDFEDLPDFTEETSAGGIDLFDYPDESGQHSEQIKTDQVIYGYIPVILTVVTLQKTYPTSEIEFCL